GADGVEGREYRNDGGLVVGRAASVEPPLRIERLARRRQGDHLAIALELFVAQSRGEGRGRPFLRIERLAIVVSVENEGAGCAGRFDFAEDHRVATWYAHQSGGDTALLHHRGDGLGVALDVRAVGSDVGDGEQG